MVSFLRNIKIQGGVAALLAYPSIAFAQAPKDLGGVANLFLKILTWFVPVLISAALILFLIGVARFIWNLDNEQERSAGKKLMIWGIIALAAMISIWGLVEILLDTFGVNLEVPFFPSPGSGSIMTPFF